MIITRTRGSTGICRAIYQTIEILCGRNKEVCLLLFFYAHSLPRTSRGLQFRTNNRRRRRGRGIGYCSIVIIMIIIVAGCGDRSFRRSFGCFVIIFRIAATIQIECRIDSDLLPRCRGYLSGRIITIVGILISIVIGIAGIDIGIAGRGLVG